MWGDMAICSEKKECGVTEQRAEICRKTGFIQSGAYRTPWVCYCKRIKDQMPEDLKRM